MNAIAKSEKLIHHPGPRLSIPLDDDEERAAEAAWAKRDATHNANPNHDALGRFTGDANGTGVRVAEDGRWHHFVGGKRVTSAAKVKQANDAYVAAMTKPKESQALKIDTKSDPGARHTGHGLPKMPTAAEANPKPEHVRAIVDDVKAQWGNYTTIGDSMKRTGLSHMETAHALARLFHDRTITLKALEGSHGGGIPASDKNAQLSVHGEALGGIGLRNS